MQVSNTEENTAFTQTEKLLAICCGTLVIFGLFIFAVAGRSDISNPENGISIIKPTLLVAIGLGTGYYVGEITKTVNRLDSYLLAGISLGIFLLLIYLLITGGTPVYLYSSLLIIFFLVSFLLITLSPRSEDNLLVKLRELFVGPIIGPLFIMATVIELFQIPVDVLTTGPHGNYSLYATLSSFAGFILVIAITTKISSIIYNY